MTTCDLKSPQTDSIRGIENFRVSRYEFVIEAVDTLYLPVYKGSTFRGGFGTAFKKVCCSDRRGDCRKCLLRHACPYAYVFETAPPEGAEALAKFEQVPHPFVLEPLLTERQEFPPGEELSFGLVLIGRGIEFLPYFIVAFQEFGKTGIGRGRGRFKLARAYATTRVPNGGGKASNASLPHPRVTDDGQEGIDRLLVFDGETNKVYMRDAVVGWDDIRAASDQLLEQIGNIGANDTPRHICNSPVDPLLSRTSIAKSCDSPFEHDLQSKTNQTHARSAASSHALHLTVSFETMTRLKFEGSLNDRPEFHVLIRSLLRRISSLLYFHHGTKLDMDFRGFISQAERVRLAVQRTRWVDWERYSSRQDTRMKLGGIVGTATYEFDDPNLTALFLPWLLLGQYVHVGKGVTFGLGAIYVWNGRENRPCRDSEIP